MDDFSEIREPHEVAERVDDDARRQVAGLDEQESRVDPEDGRVGELEARDEEGRPERLARLDSLDHVVKVSDSEQHGTKQHH